MAISLNTAITLLSFVGAIVLTLGRALWLIARIEKQVERIEAELREHLESSTLHRTPDSESRWVRIETKLDRLEEQLNRLVEAVAQNRFTRSKP